MSERKSYSILMVNLPFSGHTNPTLGLARMLTDMGHRCHLCSFAYGGEKR